MNKCKTCGHDIDRHLPNGECIQHGRLTNKEGKCVYLCPCKEQESKETEGKEDKEQ